MELKVNVKFDKNDDGLNCILKKNTVFNENLKIFLTSSEVKNLLNCNKITHNDAIITLQLPKFSLFRKNLGNEKIIRFNENNWINLNTSTDWEELWIVRDSQTQKIIDKKVVTRNCTTGMGGLCDQWGVCERCGRIEWMNNTSICTQCIQEEEEFLFG